MTDQKSMESPLEAAAGAASERAVKTFELLGNETRLGILLALWEAKPLHPSEDQSIETLLLSFSELRDRVGVRDSGQFNYHLEKLVGPLVHDTGDGYVIRGTGEDIIEAVIAGTGVEGPTLELTQIDEPCELCGAPTAIGCDFRVVYQVCTQCPGFKKRIGVKSKPDDFGGLIYLSYFNPAGISEQSPQEIYEASTARSILRLAKMMNGICSSCSAPVETSLSRCGEHDPKASDIAHPVLEVESAGGEICPNCLRRSEVRPFFVCPVCKSSMIPPASLPAGLHPAVIDFFADRGISVGNWLDKASLLRVKSLMLQQDSALVSTEPLRVRVSIRHEGEELQLTYDDNVNFTDVREGS